MAAPYGSGRSAHLHGDPFPFPGVRALRHRSRLLRSLPNSELQRFTHVVDGLNALFAARAACALGYRTSPWWGGRATGWQTQLADALALRLRRYGDAPCDLTPECALRELISIKDLYSQEPANLAPYNPAKLKVCRGETEPKPAIGLLPESAACFLRDFRSTG